MAISLASLKQTTSLTPPRILIHGVAGVGKTTFAAKSDRPVIIATEEGLGTLAVRPPPGGTRSRARASEGSANPYDGHSILCRQPLVTDTRPPGQSSVRC